MARHAKALRSAMPSNMAAKTQEVDLSAEKSVKGFHQRKEYALCQARMLSSARGSPTAGSFFLPDKASTCAAVARLEASSLSGATAAGSEEGESVKRVVQATALAVPLST